MYVRKFKPSVEAKYVCLSVCTEINAILDLLLIIILASALP